MLTMDGATIFALATPPGRSAIAMVRISGSRALTALQRLTGRREFVPRQAVLVKLYGADGEVIDEALATWFVGPASYTGEDSVELAVHGSRAVVAGVLARLTSLEGLRGAEPGEFTRRAFANGKLDLTAAEGVADLIDSETELQRRQAMRLVSGGLRDQVARWRKIAMGIAAELEAQLDFSDEGDVAQLAFEGVLRELDIFERQVRRQLDGGRRANRIRNGFTVLLAGPANAGKSTLFNLLVGSERAIVSPVAGTTRDMISADLDMDGFPISLIDSAGIRESEDVVERIGIDRAQAALASADFVLWLNAADAEGLPPPRDGPVCLCWSKSDQSPPPAGWLGFSSRTGEGLSEIHHAIVVAVSGSVGDGSDGLLIRNRHIEACQAILDSCVNICALMSAGAIELAAEELRLIMAALDRIDGRSDIEDLLGAIFARFCIGK